MIKLHGFAVSNYYNKVKFVLLEHGIPFEEVLTKLPLAEAQLAESPGGKVPYIETEQGFLCESEVIVEYLAARFPEKRIFAADPWQAAKERELITFIETHLELVARELYGEAFFGGKASDEVKATVEKRLNRYVASFKRLAKFAPYVGGEQFGVADMAAFVSLPLVGMATQKVYGRDFLAEAGVDWKAYVKLVSERPAAQRVGADRKAYLEANA
ncbi:glutathione S-transferase [Paraburkholderia tropica]|jgi:glutathione S-transferase|uniref:Glutathione S-transferase n=1 Tax=Paraburkholderia tropica TaxID=92647 RepID=A0A1A5X487_9BURK|nr:MULTISPECIES: glutathione S-transferase [Paraburkholderia]MBB2977768.1 glutathione S-transferase [Paraburkholderia tropica]OBR47888.1 glutathione S-transferase [Paraburkholderia tropica]QNB10991.1 glutathione S-transferase family protein [Paraburkholderia tropica]RQM48320.1 glutathione S-transferase family protein [Paraburkholderia bannensis]RQN35409.1 glutathione S-transferase family protein [Paraburkholderia tropica]